MSAKKAATSYRLAVRAIRALEQRVEEMHERVGRVQRDKELTAAAKTRRLGELQTALRTELRAEQTRIAEQLTRADAFASKALSGDPGDALLESRKARAASRVGRLLDSGATVLGAAQVLADAGDLDGLRALRDEVPAVVGSAMKAGGDQQGVQSRQQKTRDLLVALDQIMAPLLTGDEQAAAQLRGNVDAARAWLDALATYATERGGGTPRVTLAYARAGVADLDDLPA